MNPAMEELCHGLDGLGVEWEIETEEFADDYETYFHYEALTFLGMRASYCWFRDEETGDKCFEPPLLRLSDYLSLSDGTGDRVMTVEDILEVVENVCSADTGLPEP